MVSSGGLDSFRSLGSSCSSWGRVDPSFFGPSSLTSSFNSLRYRDFKALGSKHSLSEVAFRGTILLDFRIWDRLSRDVDLEPYIWCPLRIRRVSSALGGPRDDMPHGCSTGLSREVRRPVGLGMGASLSHGQTAHALKKNG